jgi:hypothetical protein
MLCEFPASTVDPDADTSTVTSIVVVDPQFDASKSLAADARRGFCDVDFRSSGAAALKLLSRWRADAVIVGEELDDMSGHDFVVLLGGRPFAPLPAGVSVAATATVLLR